MPQNQYFISSIVLDKETRVILEKFQKELGLAKRGGRSRAINIIIRDWDRARKQAGKAPLMAPILSQS